MVSMWSWATLTACSTHPEYRAVKAAPIARPDPYTYDFRDLRFRIGKAGLIHTTGREYFVTRWAVRNHGGQKVLLQFNEDPEGSFILYGNTAQRFGLRGQSIDSCPPGKPYCTQFLTLWPEQKLEFVLKTAPVSIAKDDSREFSIRARFRVKEENRFAYPVDLEFNGIAFDDETPASWLK